MSNEDLLNRITQLSPRDKLQLAVQLLDAGREDMAYSVADRAVNEIGAKRLVKGAKKR